MIDLFVDRSRYELQFECPREYWWTYHAYGTGIVPKGRPLYFVTGEAIHVGIQSCMLQEDWVRSKERILQVFDSCESTEKGSPLGVDLEQEQKDLAVALVFNWRLQRQAQFLAEYEPLILAGHEAIETEITTLIHQHGEYRVWLMTRPDILVRRRSDNAVIVWELKSTSMANEGWTTKWEHALQLLLQVHAAGQLVKEHGIESPVIGVVVEGFVKGVRKRDAGGIKRHSNPLIYTYVKRGDGFIIKDQYSHVWKKGLTKQLVSLSIPLEEWILSLPEEVRQEHTRVVPLLRASDTDVQSVLRQVGARTIELYEKSQAVNAEEIGSTQWKIALDLCFPQNFNNCYAFGGEGCAFLDCCFMEEIGNNALTSGQYCVRIPNHAIERELNVQPSMFAVPKKLD